MNLSDFILKIKSFTGHEPRKSGTGFAAKCPAHEDRNASLSIGEGDDSRILLRCFAGCENESIVAKMGLTLADLMPAKNHSNAAPRPASAPKQTYATAAEAISALTAGHGRKPDMTWTYHNSTGQPVGAVLRWNRPDGTKDILPLAMIEGRWSCSAMPAPRPLYRLPELLAAPIDAPIYIVEGEKCAEALAILGMIATTSAGGAKAPTKTDWTLLAGRRVHILPDNDAPGRSYADTVAATLRSLTPPATVYRIELDGLGDGEDIADWLPRRPDSETPENTIEIIQAAAKLYPATESSAKPAAAAKQTSADKRREQKAAELAELVQGVTLWHDAEGDPFSTITNNGHEENWPIASRAFARFMRGKYYAQTEAPMTDDTYQELRVALEAKATFQGERYETAIRICRTAGAIYLDLADEDWRAVRVTADGWAVVSAADCPIRFLRRRGMLPLPEPAPGGTLADLRALLNVPDDVSWVLMIAWLLGSLKPDMPQAILTTTGEQGSAKSTLCKILRSVVDPNKCAARRPPKDEQDLYIAATAGLVVSLDNLSGLQPWLSDSLCTLATGGGLAKRTLYTDSDETILDARRPIIINGIEDVATRPDLLDRSIAIHLPAIPDGNRREESAILEIFSAAHGKILGALLDGVAAGLRNLAGVKLKSLPRMADFAKWITACEPAMPWPPGAFMDAYAANRAAGNAAALEASAVASGIVALMACRDYWTGTTTELLTELDSLTADAEKRAKHWPTNPRSLTGQIERCRPNLRKAGILIVADGLDRVTRRKLLKITKATAPGPAAGQSEGSDSQPFADPSDDPSENNAINHGVFAYSEGLKDVKDHAGTIGGDEL